MIQYQGDVKVFITENGAEIKFIGGQTVMDQGLENEVLLSLFTRRWVGNALIKDPNKKLESDFEETISQSITAQMLIDSEKSAEAALASMVETGKASQINVEIFNPSSNVLIVEIEIIAPGGDVNELILTKHGANWIAQLNDPAHLKYVP